jgi:NAD(P)-dependent dehydrogenase (short-subunit alcohol dehydrogenase family)
MEIASAHAFVTGGASGIGLAIARALLAAGAAVTLADFDGERLDALGGPFGKLLLDVRNRAGWAEAKATAQAARGPVSILINNAGIGPDRTDLADSDPEAFERMLAIKLVGAFNGIHAFAADMRARGKGHIVNTASMAGLEAQPRLGAYTAAKFGLVGLTEVLRAELATHGVGVSVLCPGLVSTGLPETTAKAAGRFDPAMHRGVMPGIDPALVAERVIAGIRGNWPIILTHGERRGAVAARMEAILAAFDETPTSGLP